MRVPDDRDDQITDVLTIADDLSGRLERCQRELADAKEQRHRELAAAVEQARSEERERLMAEPSRILAAAVDKERAREREACLVFLGIDLDHIRNKSGCWDRYEVARYIEHLRSKIRQGEHRK